MKEWDYGGYAKKYGVRTGRTLKVGTGIVKCCDLMKAGKPPLPSTVRARLNLPDFMRTARVIFVDPPCSRGNLKSFYTKADKELERSFEYFQDCLFLAIKTVNPVMCFVEVFQSNKRDVMDFMSHQFEYTVSIESTYYHNKKNKCWIILGAHVGYKKVIQELEEASGSPSSLDLLDPLLAFQSIVGMDEQNVIEWICKNVLAGTVIGDFCMGRGLVGFYANKYGRPFVGTELNPNRLAVLFHRIETGKL